MGTVVLDRVRNWLASGPVSVVLSAALFVFSVVRAATGSEALTTGVVAGPGHGWWTVFTYPIWTVTPLHMLIDVALLLTLGIWLERLMGSVWYAVVGLGSQWVGGAVAIGLAGAIRGVDATWAEGLSHQYLSGVAGFFVGAAMAASVQMDALWRRRVRIGVLVVLGTAVAFTGSLESIAATVAALVGWAAGSWLWRAEKDTRPLVGVPKEGRVIIALVVAGVAIGSLMALRSTEMIGVLAHLRGDLTMHVDEGQVAQICDTSGLQGQCAHMSYLLRSSGLAARILTVMPIAAQLVLAWGLRGGRRAAFWGTLGLQGVTAGIAVAHYLVVAQKVQVWETAAELLGLGAGGAPTARFIVPILVPLVLGVVVAANYKLFTVKAAAGTYRRYWAVVAGTAAVALAIFVTGGMVARHTFTPEATVFGLIGDFLVRLLPAPALYLVTPQFQSDSRVLAHLGDWVVLVPWVVAVAGALWTFRRRALPSSISREEYQRVVGETNAGTMAWMSTWDGNNYWMSPTGAGAVAYRADLGVGLTVTDPAARPENLEQVMQEFADFCAEQGLVPAFYSIHGAAAAVTDAWGWPRLQVAEESIIELPNLAFTGKKFQGVRSSINRAAKEGVTDIWTTWAECPEDLRNQIIEVSEQWAGEKALPEMGFTLGGVAELDDPPVRILVAVDKDGKLHGATSWMPVYEDGRVVGWTLDFMRRRDDGFPPVMQYMIARAAVWGQENGYEILSLSGAPLAHAELQGEGEAGSSAAYLDYILEILGKGLEPVYGFRSLLKFKSKFQPRYEPVFLTIPDLATLPQVGLAIGHAYLPNMTARDMVNLVGALRAHEK